MVYRDAPLEAVREGGRRGSSLLGARCSVLGARCSVLGYLVPAGAWAILVRCVWMGRASREVCAAGLARVLGRARRTRQVARHAFCKTTNFLRPTSHAPSHALSEERSPERAPQLAPPPPSRRATPSRRSFAPGHPFNVMAASVELPCFRAAYGLTLHAKAAPVPRVETGRRVLAAWRYMHMSVE